MEKGLEEEAQAYALALAMRIEWIVEIDLKILDF